MRARPFVSRLNRFEPVAAGAKAVRVLVVGDSALGFGTPSFGRQLKSALEKRFGGIPVRLADESEPGLSALRASLMLPAWLQQHRPDFVVTMIGYADFFYATANRSKWHTVNWVERTLMIKLTKAALKPVIISIEWLSARGWDFLPQELRASVSYSYATVLLRMGSRYSALEFVNRRRTASSWQTHLVTASLLEGYKDCAGAVIHFESSLEMNPDQPPIVYNKLLGCYLKEGQREEGADFFERLEVPAQLAPLRLEILHALQGKAGGGSVERTPDPLLRTGHFLTRLLRLAENGRAKEATQLYTAMTPDLAVPPHAELLKAYQEIGAACAAAGTKWIFMKYPADVNENPHASRPARTVNTHGLLSSAIHRENLSVMSLLQNDFLHLTPKGMDTLAAEVAQIIQAERAL